MASKCIKLEIVPVAEGSESRAEVYKIVRDMIYNMWLASNKAVTRYYMEDLRVLEERSQNEDKSYKKDVEIYGVTISTVVRNLLKSITEDKYGSNILDAQNRFIQAQYKINKNTGKLFKGESSLLSFKRDLPVYVHNRGVKLYTDEGNTYFAEVNILSVNERKRTGQAGNYKFKIIKPDKSSKSTLDKLIGGEYKLGACNFKFNKKGKLMFTITYTFEVKKDESINPNRVLGVKMGIDKVAVLSIYDSEIEDYEKVSYRESILDGGELKEFRKRMQARAKSMGIASKWASDNKTGHGYKQRMGSANKLEDKCAKFRDTFNHKVSRYIVDYAKKKNCGIIQLENLSGFSAEQKEVLLKSWAYHDLGAKITYKAEESGIVVRSVDTDILDCRCSKCGHIDKERNKFIGEEIVDGGIFGCIKCGYKENREINRSKNIAFPCIDEIVKDKNKKTK